MPIYFKTVIKEGGVAGRGVFALEDIPKGAVWWRAYCEEPPVTPGGPNTAYTKDNIGEFVATHSPEEIANVVHHSKYYVEGDTLIYLEDGQQCMNHSSDPNSQVILNKEGDWKRLRSYALRDIKAGEEILEDYGNYIKGSGGWIEPLVHKYDPDRLAIEVELGIKEYPNKHWDDGK